MSWGSGRASGTRMTILSMLCSEHCGAVICQAGESREAIQCIPFGWNCFVKTHRVGQRLCVTNFYMLLEWFSIASGCCSPPCVVMIINHRSYCSQLYKQVAKTVPTNSSRGLMCIEIINCIPRVTFAPLLACVTQEWRRVNHYTLGNRYTYVIFQIPV